MANLSNNSNNLHMMNAGASGKERERSVLALCEVSRWSNRSLGHNQSGSGSKDPERQHIVNHTTVARTKNLHITIDILG